MIVISEVINWLRDDSVVSRRGPNAIVVAADFYDYELVATVYPLPEEKNNAILQLKSVLDSMVDAGAEDCDLRVQWGKKSLNENKKKWDHGDINSIPPQDIIKEVMDILEKNWEDIWSVEAYQSGSETWEIEWRRHNFV